MDIQIERSHLFPAFAMAMKCVPARSPKPILQNVLLETNPDGKSVTLASTNLQQAFRVSIPASVDITGRVLIPATRMQQILATIQDGTFRLAYTGEELEVGAGWFGATSNFALVSDDPDAFPSVEIDLTSLPGTYGVQVDELLKGLAACRKATDPESTRYALGGVRFEPDATDATVMNLVGTDGRRLHRFRIGVTREGTPYEISGAANGVLPVHVIPLIDSLGRMQNKELPVRFTIGPDKFVFGFEHGALVTPTVEGRYPRWQDVVPKESPACVLEFADPRTLDSLFAQAAIMQSDESRAVLFEVDGEGITLSSRSPDVGKAKIDAVADRVDGEPTFASVDPRYIRDGIDACRLGVTSTDQLATQIKVKHNGHKTAMLIESDVALVVAMPLSVDGSVYFHRKAVANKHPELAAMPPAKAGFDETKPGTTKKKAAAAAAAE